MMRSGDAIAGRPVSHAARDGVRVRTRVRLVLVLCLMLAFGASCSTDPSYSGRSAEEWIVQLRTAPDSLQRRAAADALGRILEINPRSEQVTAALVQALADTSDEVRLAAGTALEQDRRLPAVAIPGLARALADSDHVHTREHSAGLLSMVSPKDAMQVAPALMRALDDPDQRVRAAAVAALGRLGRNAPQVGDALRGVGASSSALAQDGARRALALITPDSVASQPRLP
jgi:HEAT repeat protein